MKDIIFYFLLVWFFSGFISVALIALAPVFAKLSAFFCRFKRIRVKPLDEEKQADIATLFAILIVLYSVLYNAVT